MSRSASVVVRRPGLFPWLAVGLVRFHGGYPPAPVRSVGICSVFYAVGDRLCLLPHGYLPAWSVSVVTPPGSLRQCCVRRRRGDRRSSAHLLAPPTHRLDPNHERAALIMQKLLRRERDPDGAGGSDRTMAVPRRGAGPGPGRALAGEEENVAEVADDILAAPAREGRGQQHEFQPDPFPDGADQQESLQQQLYQVSTSCTLVRISIQGYSIQIRKFVFEY